MENSNEPKGERIVIKKFPSPKEIVHWLGEVDIEQLKKEMVEKYGPNDGALDMETNEFVIFKKT